MLKRMILSFCRLTFILIPVSSFSQTSNDPAALVNPFVGTAMSSIHDYGKTVPGAVRPFGMLYWSPDTYNEVFYVYERPVTRGFSLTHISGPGIGASGDVPVFPILGALEKSPLATPEVIRASFSHAHERAEPGYYEVTLDSGIEVRLAAQTRSGIAEFRFPSGPVSHTLLINLSRNLVRVSQTEILFDGRMATGSVTSRIGGRNQYQIYFAIETDQMPETYGTFDEYSVTPGNRSASGPKVGGYLSFSSSTAKVSIRVGISYVSVANAKANLRHEIPGWDFEKVRKDARAAWNDALGHVQVKGGEEKDLRIFYTALYHSLLHPTVSSDVNGEYIGLDGKVHTDGGHIQYSNFSGWDIYRSQVQLLAMLFPKEASDMAQSLVRDAEQGGGGLPSFVWSNTVFAGMIGDSGPLILAGMYAFGARGFDTKTALSAMLLGANNPLASSNGNIVRRYLDEYLRQGYVTGSGKQIYGPASIALEYQNADFAISRMAEALGDTANARAFLNRSAQWRKIFDPDTKYIRPRGPDGKFVPGFTSGNEAGFVEGNSAHYTWMIPYDLAEVVAAVGGPEAAKERLDIYFSKYYDWTLKNGPYVFISNEECLGNPWVYNWTGHPWRTQEVVRKTLWDLYSPDPNGLPGNDDLGSMSSWAVFAQLGMFPEIPGVGGLTLNSPMFPEVKLRLGEHEVLITAKGAPSKLYVKSVKLDGEPVRNWWIDWERLSKASKLDFLLTAEPDHDPGQPPPSFAPEDK